ncbi:hypothetical protein HBA_0823 [Sodalis endosymbiont of Henestaris halophilus]|nr:hypothetical protein HBA_0823 [Sodalis endosymbiont of Henestaris halophilus]
MTYNPHSISVKNGSKTIKRVVNLCHFFFLFILLLVSAAWLGVRIGDINELVQSL